MCPELILGIAYDAKKADVFSIGTLMFVLLTGIPPFNKADP